MSPSRPYHHGNLRAALLDEAERVVGARGVDALSLRELARSVGVSHAAPRRHFADRQALLDALAEAGFERLGAAMAGAVDGAGAAFAARIGALARAYVGFATEHAALLELMFASKHREGAARVQEAGDRAFAVPRAVIAAAQRSGELGAGDPERIATVLFATIQGLASLANSGMLDGQPLDAVLGDAVGRLLDGLRPR